ncbi:FliH/SctL family protein [Telmatospirillum siberiense]|uniref:Flagellar assembly protein FliH n=1 Tax=Telmatospirillum siberiense TaxID=382514 RepID=A0A2N3PZY7_9PROT|nr:FliH/SctL family protein [Telmatospirillum siberiense]PKU25959.1 flagellar assembly protein FliH [Telmatospirillum siberiense]
MAKLQKYLFDLDFDAPPPRPMEIVVEDEFADMTDEALEDVPPPPPTFSEEELALAREQATEAGRQAGLQEAESYNERLIAWAMEAIATQLQDMAAIQEAANEERMRDAVAVATAVIRKLLPETSREHDLEEITGVVRECLSHIEKDIRVTIRVNPEHMDNIREQAEQAAETTGFEGKLIFTADPRIAPGDCRVEWGDGGAERDQARLWEEIDSVIARAMGEPLPDPVAEENPGDADGEVAIAD